jgi:hypothetical protein
MNDWDTCFALATLVVLGGGNPYMSIPYYYNPPWMTFVLAPIAWLPPVLAMALPLAALTYAAYKVRKPWLILLVGTSYPFVAQSLYANVDWIVLVGVVMKGPLGAILMTTKPQTGGLAFIAELREKTWRQRLFFVVPLAVVIGISTLMFPEWMDRILHPTILIAGNRNFSFFPYSLVLFPFALYFCWKRSDPLWGVVASLCVAPYYYVHSYLAFIFLLSDRNWKWGLALSVVLWGVFALVYTGVLNLNL